MKQGPDPLMVTLLHLFWSLSNSSIAGGLKLTLLNVTSIGTRNVSKPNPLFNATGINWFTSINGNFAINTNYHGNTAPQWIKMKDSMVVTIESKANFYATGSMRISDPWMLQKILYLFRSPSNSSLAARPKSPILTPMVSVRNMLPSLRSRWMTQWECR